MPAKLQFTRVLFIIVRRRKAEFQNFYNTFLINDIDSYTIICCKDIH